MPKGFGAEGFFGPQLRQVSRGCRSHGAPNGFASRASSSGRCQDTASNLKTACLELLTRCPLQPAAAGVSSRMWSLGCSIRTNGLTEPVCGERPDESNGRSSVSWKQPRRPQRACATRLREAGDAFCSSACSRQPQMPKASTVGSLRALLLLIAACRGGRRAFTFAPLPPRMDRC